MTPEKQDHAEWAGMLHAFVDGELDSVHATRFEAHLAACADCQAELKELAATRNVLARPEVGWRAPPELRSQVLAAISREGDTSRKATGNLESGWRRLLRLFGQWSLAPSLAAFAASLFLFFNAPAMQTALQDQIVANHVRSLLADHLADVITSDRHTVKPWFAGKIDFSPPVVDLRSEGFPLVGGRVDYLNGKVVAALVYRRGGHVINLFIWPDANQRDQVGSHEGYNIREWSAAGLAFSAVSDTEAGELQSFEEKFVAATRAADAKTLPSGK